MVRVASGAVAVMLVCITATDAPAEVRATGHDAISLPGGQGVQVSAKFETWGFGWVRGDIKNKTVVFDVEGSQYEATTDRDGHAQVTLPTAPSRNGTFPVQAWLKGRKDDGVAQGRLFVTERPLAVVDVDGTLSDMNDIVIFVAAKHAKTFPDAPGVIQDLAQTHQIVYLTARDDNIFTRPTQTFLQRHGFPTDAPVLFNDLGLTSRRELAQMAKSSARQRYKADRIEDLKSRGLDVALGIGNGEHDAAVYEAAGIPSYIHDPKGKRPGPASFNFRSYAQLRERLVADRVLTGPPREGAIDVLGGLTGS